jgi:ketosteroid isomerase-like protein
MKRNSVAFGAILIAIASLAVARISLAAADDKNAKGLIAVDNDWSNAAVAKDVDRVASFYATDGVVFPPDEPIAIGKGAARKVWADAFADASYQISWKTTSAGVAKDMGGRPGLFSTRPKVPMERGSQEWEVRLCVAQGYRRQVEGHPRHLELHTK